MSKQQDLFNPIQEDGHTAYWHSFYAPTFRRMAREKKEKELKEIESMKSISILIEKSDK